MTTAALQTYLPPDRLRTLAHGETLPDRTTGSALFADISGFTPLTEALRELLGARRGAEELAKHLDTVFNSLIAETDKHGGSVVGFAGDAITCWFDESTSFAAQRAMACALALQRAMPALSSIVLPNQATITLALKVSIASGTARRFVVGDPNIQYLDVLAGPTVSRTSTAEQLAQKGEILLDEATATLLGPLLKIVEWRTDTDGGQRFAVAEDFAWDIRPVHAWAVQHLRDEQLRAWILRPVYEREVSHRSALLTELRPCVALFVRFMGIDYDADDGQEQLDTFIQRTQRAAKRYAGTLINITVGDKGSYVYIDLGAMSVHEDDARRAVRLALKLRDTAEMQLQMGITLGTMCVGSFGSQTRRTFGTLGDEVNFAARLMQIAAPGEILLSGHVHRTVGDDFVFEPRSPLKLKGKSEL